MMNKHLAPISCIISIIMYIIYIICIYVYHFLHNPNFHLWSPLRLSAHGFTRFSGRQKSKVPTQPMWHGTVDGSEIRRLPVEVGSLVVYPIIYNYLPFFGFHPRWLFGISAINRMTKPARILSSVVWLSALPNEKLSIPTLELPRLALNLLDNSDE